MPTNTAAWMAARKARLQVGPAPHTPPADDEIVVADRAVAVNPVDWITQDFGYLISSYIHYPWVLGSDLAGEVVEVGSAVTRFAVGDRVLGHAVGFDKHRTRAAEGAFQDYTVVPECMASPIPDTLTYEQACVVPMSPALASGHFVAAPPPLVVGGGLEHLPPALDRQKDSVSAQKVVVSL